MFLIPSIAYQSPPRKFVEPRGKAPNNWMQILLDKFCKKDSGTFMSRVEDYRYRNEITNALRLIYFKLTDPLISADEKEIIIYKLNEGIELCLPGFHNRVNEILESMHSIQNFTELLAQIRTDIVRRTAANLTDNIHTVNSFLRQGAQMYGSYPLNNHDIYYGDFPVGYIQDQLDQAFRFNYRFYQTLQQGWETIYAQLVNAGYVGKLPLPQATPQREKYLKESVDFLNILRKFIPETVLSAVQESDDQIDTVFIVNEDDEVIDLNIPAIKKSFLRQYQAQNHFLLTEKEDKFLEYCLRETDENLSFEEFKKLIPNSLFNSYDEIEYFLEYFKNNKMRNHTLPFFHKVLAAALDSDFDNEGNSYLMRLFARPSPSPLRASIFHTLDLDTQINALSRVNNKKNNALMLALEHSGKDTEILLDLISTFSPLVQGHILKQKNKSGNNCFSLILSKKPHLIEPFLKLFTNLSLEDKIELLKTTSVNNLNVLIYANKYPLALSAVLSVMQELPMAEQIEFISKPGRAKCNALITATAFNRESLSLLLNAVSKFPEHEKIKMLQQTTSYGWNVLSFSLRYHPINIDLVLDSIAYLPVKEQIALIKGPHICSLATAKYHRPEKEIEVRQCPVRHTLKCLNTLQNDILPHLKVQNRETMKLLFKQIQSLTEKAAQFAFSGESNFEVYQASNSLAQKMLDQIKISYERHGSGKLFCKEVKVELRKIINQEKQSMAIITKHRGFKRIIDLLLSKLHQMHEKLEYSPFFKRPSTKTANIVRSIEEITDKNFRPKAS